jgi:DhnA family fructose-bisphosphate aldolase class Ia
VLDASLFSVSFITKAKTTTDLTVPQQAKQQLKEQYEEAVRLGKDGHEQGVRVCRLRQGHDR